MQINGSTTAGLSAHLPSFIRLILYFLTFQLIDKLRTWFNTVVLSERQDFAPESFKIKIEFLLYH